MDAVGRLDHRGLDDPHQRSQGDDDHHDCGRNDSPSVHDPTDGGPDDDQSDAPMNIRKMPGTGMT